MTPTLPIWIMVSDYAPRNKGRIHASLQQNTPFVFAPPAIVIPSVPTQQIVIMSASICQVSYGGSR